MMTVLDLDLNTDKCIVFQSGEKWEILWVGLRVQSVMGRQMGEEDVGSGAQSFYSFQ